MGPNPLVIWWHAQRRRKIPCSALIMVFMVAGTIVYGNNYGSDRGFVIPRERLQEFGFHPDALQKYSPLVACFSSVASPMLETDNPERLMDLPEKALLWYVAPENKEPFFLGVPANGQMMSRHYRALTIIQQQPKIGEKLCIWQLPDPNHWRWITIVSNTPYFFRLYPEG